MMLGTGVYVPETEYVNMMHIWYIENQKSMLTELSWIVGKVTFSEYVDSILYQKFFILLRSFAEKNGLTDRYMPLVLDIKTRQILKVER